MPIEPNVPFGLQSPGSHSRPDSMVVEAFGSHGAAAIGNPRSHSLQTALNLVRQGCECKVASSLQAPFDARDVSKSSPQRQCPL